jgi:hypothetical protein
MLYVVEQCGFEYFASIWTFITLGLFNVGHLKLGLSLFILLSSPRYVYKLFLP